jgi:microcystin-dependent protein
MGDRRRNLGIPSGVVFPFAGNTAPYGYLVCDGRAVSRTEFASLFLMIGTSHGAGDGSATFNLPDYRGNFLRGRVGVNTITGSGTSASNQATFTNHGINRTGFKVRLSSGTLSGLSTATDYFAIVVDSNTLAFATTQANALANTRIAISGANSAVIVQYEDPDASSRTASNTGGNTGNNVGSVQADANLAHTHTIPMSGTVSATTQRVMAGTTANTQADLQTVSSGGNEARPKNVTVNYIIKV